jgi:hypothetical protein
MMTYGAPLLDHTLDATNTEQLIAAYTLHTKRMSYVCMQLVSLITPANEVRVPYLEVCSTQLSAYSPVPVF